MKLKFLTPLNHLERRAAVFAVLLCLAAFPARAQTEKPPAPGAPEKAEQILRRAVEALGGSNYLNVRTLVGRGLFTQFKDGETGLPATFVDYVVYPDRERTEFKGGGTRFIQTNTGKTGWTYDSAAKSIKDMTPEQVADFQTGMRTSVDYLLRGYWRKDGAALAYVGRREAGLARRNETVRLTYSDGFAVEFEFGAQDGLPAKVVYKKKNAEGEEVPEEDRFAQFVNIQGVVTPFVVDHFRAGAQVSRVNYQSV
ncbi:MAG TPA: hypothetical protein VF507_03575, partial [Pyrinomonadaceae bacterium]